MRTVQILWLFLIPLHFLNLCINIVVVNGHCLGHQQSSLLHLKDSLLFNLTKSRKLVHWNQSDDCCQWSGVTCNKGRVIALDLSDESIFGGLDSSSSLFNLKYLQHLNLAGNDTNSTVPTELHKLEDLRYLNLSNAGFKGQIPGEISYVKKLAFLDLSTSLFTSSHDLKLEEPNIATLVQNFTEIKELNLDGVRISAKGKEWRPALSSLRNLQVLSMSFCNLSGPIDSSLSKLQSLSVLRLKQNKMESSVPVSLMTLANLTTLHLSSCNLIGEFPRKIFQIPNLQVLDMSDNPNLHGTVPNITWHGSLKILNLSKTNFSGHLPYSIHNLSKLSTIDLSNCQFNGTLPSSVSELIQLVHLDFSLNNFTGPLPSFNKSKSLTHLSLFQNDLTGAVLSSHFEGLENLTTIDLAGNSFIGRIPSSLFTLPSLQILMLSANKFEGLLDEIQNASSSMLELLDVSGNNLQGPIPISLFHLTRLFMLQLTSNKFNGTIQLDSIRRMTNLAILALSHNNLSIDGTLRDNHNLSSFSKLKSVRLASCKLREFPVILKDQSSLRYLDLSINQIHGTIPNWIWRFQYMVYLNLSVNFLTSLEGPLPNISSNLFHLDLHSNQLEGTTLIFTNNLIYLDCSSNRFSYIAPPDLGNYLSFAYFLSLSNNSFHGKIHESFCNATNLRVFDLSDNNFSGNIPECLIKRMSDTVRALNLGGNNLQGQISDTFSTSCTLRFLDLSKNALGGIVPRSLGNCQKLQVLNLNNNQFVDRFPCLLRNTSTLRVLILQSNNFLGPLECPNKFGDWENLQIVDLAFNDFSGKLPVTLLQSWKALMLDENEAGPNFGHIFSEIGDNDNPVNFDRALSIVNKDHAMKLAKLVVFSPFVTNRMIFDDYVEQYGRRSYQDSVTIVNKGIWLKLDKIVFAFASLDFSSNHFKGSIPEELMSLKALHALNLSQNALSGPIPSSIGNLKHLESLDLSLNFLSGNIPTELASLSFLSFLNMSYNHLMGPIPTGTQIQSFEADSFRGNEGLCGPPLTQNCNIGEIPSSEAPKSNSRSSSIDWNFLSAELGNTFGLGVVILPLIFWKGWRVQYFRHVDNILWKIFPQLEFVYVQRGGINYRTLRWKPF